MKHINFGIIGCGKIAPRFTDSIKRLSDCSVVAVAARDTKRAADFAKKHCPNAVAYGDYESLCADNNVDAVYIATPHALHMEQVLLAFKHKKHVLCEKIMTTDTDKLNTLFDAAKKAGVLLMEAMWTRFNPVYEAVGEVIRSKQLGEVVGLDYTIAFDASGHGDDARLNSLELAGGALFDIGIYNINAATFFHDEAPTLGECSVTRTHTGVDGDSRFVLKFNKFDARLRCCITENLPSDLIITLEKGSIVIPNAIFSQNYTVNDGNEDICYEVQDKVDFSYEIDHFCHLIRQGKKDSDRFGRKESSMVMGIMDEFRKRVGLVYPFD